MKVSYEQPLLPSPKTTSSASNVTTVIFSILLFCCVLLLLRHDELSSFEQPLSDEREFESTPAVKRGVLGLNEQRALSVDLATPRQRQNAIHRRHSAVLVREEPAESKLKIKPVRCDDPERGYETLHGSCGNIQHYSIRLTLFGKSIYIPMVLDRNAVCESPDACEKKDKWTCCQERRSCKNWAEDVAGNCPNDMVLNPYKYAFCQTIPCTYRDIAICCIPHVGALYERQQRSRSRRARRMPMKESPPVTPEISFAHHDTIWVDTSISPNTMNGEVWFPLVNFMNSWGEGHGWETGAWIKYQNEGENPKYRKLKLNVHHISCTDSIDSLPFFESEMDTYLVSCPRLCLGKPVRRLGQDVFEWEFHKGKLTRKTKAIPLYKNRDRTAVKYGTFGKGVFTSMTKVDQYSDRLWVRVQYQDGQEYWMPTVDIMANGKIGKYADQVVSEVQGCGGKGFFENEWFTSSSPICVAARLGKMYGGNEPIEVTLGPKRQKYRGCKHGGIKSSTLTDVTTVKRSYRVAPHGTEMLRKGGGWLARRFYRVWKHTVDHIRHEGPVRVFTKLALKIGFFIGWTLMCGTIVSLTASGVGTPVAGLLVVSLIFFRPLINMAASVMIDTTVDWLFPRVADFFRKKLDLGPTNSQRHQKLLSLSAGFKKHFSTQFTPVNYAYSVLFETIGQGFRIFQITGMMNIASVKPLGIFRFVHTKKSYDDQYAVGGSRIEDRSLADYEITDAMSESFEESEMPIIDFSYAFIDAVQQAANDLFHKIATSEHQNLSRVHAFGMMVGIDVEKLLEADDVSDAIGRECMKPNCILNQIGTTGEGTLNIPVDVLPFLAQNLGVNFALKEMRVNKKWFSIQDCKEGTVLTKCRCGNNLCDPGRECSALKDCMDVQHSYPICPEGPTEELCECSHEICAVSEICDKSGWCDSEISPNEYAEIWYFALENDDTSLSAKLLSNVCPPESPECSSLEVQVDRI